MKKILLAITTLFTINNLSSLPNLLKGKTNLPNTFINALAQGEALSFDGVDDMVKTIGFTGFTQYTFEGWFKFNNLNNQSLIVGTSASGPNVNFSQCLTLESGILKHYLYDGTARTVTSTVQPTVGVWYHIAITANNGGKMRIIVNNTETISSFNIGTMWGGVTTIVLAQPTSPNGYFNGDMDDVRYWGRDCCFGEILNNMNGEIQSNGALLLANYHFNQGTAGGSNSTQTLLTDATFQNHGTLQNFTLNGNTSNYISPGAVVAGSFVPSFSSPTVALSASTNTVCSNSNTQVVLTANATGASSFEWLSGQSTTSNTIAVTPNTSSINYGVNAIVNGCYSNFAVVTFTIIQPPVITASNGYICTGGTYTLNPSGGLTYTYSGGSNVVTPTSTTTYSISGNNSDGCIGSTTATVFVQPCGQSGSSLSLDGIDDVVNTTVPYSNFTNTWTFECWAKSPYSPVTNNGYDGPMYATNMAIIWNHAQSNYIGSASVQSNDGTFYSAQYGSLNPDEWYHLAATYDGRVLCAYKNGVLTNSVSTNGGLKSITTGDIMLGRHPSQPHFWEGTMDEARIWNTVRTCSEINQFMNTELSGNETGLYAYYNFNEGTPMGNNTSITSVNDKTSNVLNASISNFALTGNSSNFFLGAPFNATQSCGTTTGITKYKNESIISIYPNPTNTILNIEVKEQTQITIVNVLGDIVLKQTIDGSNSLDVTSLTSGVYYIQDLKSGKAIKFIKE